MWGRRRIAALGAVVGLVVLLTVLPSVRPVGSDTGASGQAYAGMGTGLHAFALTAPSGTCPSSGPLGGLNTLESVVVLVLIAIAGVGAGIVIGRRWALSKGGSGAGHGSTEPPDPALNPQPLPPGFRPPEPQPALNPQPLPPGVKPPEPPTGGDRPT